MISVENSGRNEQLLFHFTTQVWGEPFTSLLTDVTLPLVLSSGNLPAIPNVGGCTFDLYTTSADYEKIALSASFQRLRNLMHVEVEYIDDLDKTNHHEAMSQCNRLAVSKSDEKGAVIVFLQPDTLVSDGTLEKMVRVIQSGKRVVQIAGFRTLLENMVPLIKKHYDQGTASITLSGRQIVEYAKDNLHPISQTCLWDSKTFTNYNAHIYWRIDNEGYFARCAHFHPLAVYPRVKNAQFDFTVDYNYFDVAVPDFEDYYIANDSDDMFMCEMSRASYFVGSDAPNTASPLKIATWMEFNATEKHRQSFVKKIRFHTGSMDSLKWADTERFSDSVLDCAMEFTNISALKALFVAPNIVRERIRLYHHRRDVFHRDDRWLIIPLASLHQSYKKLAFALRHALWRCLRMAKAVIRPVYYLIKKNND